VSLLLLVDRLLLAAVFAVAGLAKLADRLGSQRAVEQFGIPRGLSSPIGVLLPMAELVVAAALIPTVTARWGALGALLLLVIFGAGISINVARGRRPDCHCFGQLHSAPVGWTTLIRNGVLAGAAALLVWQGWDDPGASASAWIRDLSAAESFELIALVVLAVLVVLEGWLGLNLLRQQGRLLLRLDALEQRASIRNGQIDLARSQVATPGLGLPVGSVAPEFRLRDLDGQTLTLSTLLACGKPVMMLFTDPDCGPCTVLMPEISQWQQQHPDRLSIALISAGTLEANRANADAHGLRKVLLQERYEVAEAYLFAGTPSAVLVDAAGRVASPLSAGAEAIRSLLRWAVIEPAPLPLLPTQDRSNYHGQGHFNGVHHGVARTPSLGDSAPSFALLDLTGTTVELTDLRGQEILLLFWNPECGFCQQMLPDLHIWEQQRPASAPAVVVVSTGSHEESGLLRLQSSILLDPHGHVMKTFGATGTPTAILIDPLGNVASELVVGASAVFALARIRARSENRSI
jgi:peroxiredoxin/uncharacterized membrane protein YphA (DoxX/SURF4 family)